MADYLTIYLRDHHAAAHAGVRLAHRAAAGTQLPYASRQVLLAIAGEIEEDFASLEKIMAELGVASNPLKDALMAGGARLGVLKLNGRLLQRSPLSDVFELEALGVGIIGKQALWRSLMLSGRAVDKAELQRLIERAQDQAKRVLECRAEAAEAAFRRSPALTGVKAQPE